MIRLIWNSSARAGATLVALVLLAACGVTEPRRTSPVTLHLRSNAVTSTAATAPTPLQLSAVRLIVTSAALGSGNEFGCTDCQGNVEEVVSTPKLVSIPINGGSVLLATEQAAPGLYSQSEIAVEQAGATSLAGTSNWPSGATIMIEGTYNGAAFALPLNIVGSFRESLTPPLEVPATGAPAATAITITLPVASWFQSTGRSLNPADATDRATIEANARRGFAPLEAESRER